MQISNSQIDTEFLTVLILFEAVLIKQANNHAFLMNEILNKISQIAVSDPRIL